MSNTTQKRANYIALGALVLSMVAGLLHYSNTVAAIIPKVEQNTHNIALIEQRQTDIITTLGHIEGKLDVIYQLVVQDDMSVKY